jgi:hypothetical protein
MKYKYRRRFLFALCNEFQKKIERGYGGTGGVLIFDESDTAMTGNFNQYIKKEVN